MTQGVDFDISQLRDYDWRLNYLLLMKGLEEDLKLRRIPMENLDHLRSFISRKLRLYVKNTYGPDFSIRVQSGHSFYLMLRASFDIKKYMERQYPGINPESVIRFIRGNSVFYNAVRGEGGMHHSCRTTTRTLSMYFYLFQERGNEGQIAIENYRDTLERFKVSIDFVKGKIEQYLRQHAVFGAVLNHTRAQETNTMPPAPPEYAQVVASEAATAENDNPF